MKQSESQGRIMNEMEAHLIQGTESWKELRKQFITSTDSAVIMGLNSHKTPYKLWRQKMDLDPPDEVNEKMTRGTLLEPLARDYLEKAHGIKCKPAVVTRDFMMASLDGITDDGIVIEIKCGEKSYQQALNGEIPPYYLCQLQHQMACSNAFFCKYAAYNGETAIVITVDRDNEFIKKMIEKEQEFYQCLITFTPPPLTRKDYVEKNDAAWMQCSTKYSQVSEEIKILEQQQKKLRDELIILSGQSSSMGNGISVQKIVKKGSIDYDSILSEYNIDIEKYRKKELEYWSVRIDKNSID